MDYIDKVICGDCTKVLAELPEASIDLVVTSPPYFGQRLYSSGEEIGAKSSLRDYIHNMMVVADSIKRVLKPDGSYFLNIGDCYVSSNLGNQCPTSKERKKGTSERWQKQSKKDVDGISNKSMAGIPWRLAIAMIDDGWLLRNDIVWAKRILVETGHQAGRDKPDPLVFDRFSNAKEYVFFFSKSRDYYFNSLEYRALPSVWLIQPSHGPGRNWDIKHFATFPGQLVLPIIESSCRKGGVVLDPFAGSGVTLLMAKKLGRHYCGIDLSQKYVDFMEKRLKCETDQLVS